MASFSATPISSARSSHSSDTAANTTIAAAETLIRAQLDAEADKAIVDAAIPELGKR